MPGNCIHLYLPGLLGVVDTVVFVVDKDDSSVVEVVVVVNVISIVIWKTSLRFLHI